jgi:hypothetical protein
MANLTCSLCEQEQGLLMDTNLQDGDTTIVGPACMAGYALTMAASLTEGMPPEAGEAYGELLDRIAANDPRPPKDAPRKRRGPLSKTLADDSQEPVPDSPDIHADGPAASAGTEAPPPVPSDVPVAVTLPEPCPDCGATEGTGDDAKVVCNGCGKVIATTGEAPF